MLGHVTKSVSYCVKRVTGVGKGLTKSGSYCVKRVTGVGKGLTKSGSYCVKRVTGVGTRHKEHPILCEESDVCWDTSQRTSHIV